MKTFPDPYDHMSDDEIETVVGSLVAERRTQGHPIERMGDKSVSISLRLSADLLARLKAVAKEHGIPYQTLMTQWIEQGLSTEAAEKAGTYRVVLREEDLDKARTTGLLLVIESAQAAMPTKEARSS